MSNFNCISYRQTSIHARDERDSFFPFRFEGFVSGGRSGQFGTFYFFLLGLGDSAIFKLCLENFSKDSYVSKNVVSKNKANYKLMLLVQEEKNFQEIIKINITKLFS